MLVLHTPTGSHFLPCVRPFFDSLDLSPAIRFAATGLLVWGVPLTLGTVWVERLKAFYQAHPGTLEQRAPEAVSSA